MKSSGETSSRKSLNSSTTCSLSSMFWSNSIEDSSMTSSATKIGASTRTARAKAETYRQVLNAVWLESDLHPYLWQKDKEGDKPISKALGKVMRD